MKKYGPQSRYYLYVKFKPGYGSTFTYHSDDSRGSERGLQNLLRRVLKRSIAGRFEYAKLVDREESRTIAYFLDNGEMYSAESWAARLQQQRTKAPGLKASVCFYQAELKVRVSYGLPPLVTLQAACKNEYGTGLSCALVNLHRQVNELAAKMPFRIAYIFQHPGNIRVAQLHPDGQTEVTSKRFYEQVMAEQLVPAEVLKIKLK